MRTAETVLNVIRERGARGLPLEDIYRQLYNRELYLRAYGRLYSNQGAMTKGTTAETVDGMSLAKIDRIIDELRHERFRWTPVRRVNIPKPNGKTRPLGIPTWTDKLLQEVIRMILEAYYEPQFSDHSHGFRPDRGCHTALSEVVNHWTGVRWFVEGDIKGCFDYIDHEVMLSILGEKLHDNRFLRLLKYLLKAGYMEEWKYGRTLSGTPQGGVVSPILANVYLDRLDKFVETVLIPAKTRGTERRRNLTWKALNGQMSYHRGRGNHALAQWVMGQSLVKTLAAKHKTSTRKMVRRYKSTVLTEHGERACLKVEVQRGNGKRSLVAQFGGIPLKRKRQAVLVDQKPQPYRFERNELIQRLLANECEMCGSTVDVQVHHVRALRDLNVKGQGEKPLWIQIMATRRRKTLVVCRPCHLNVHGGSWQPRKQK